MANIGQYIQSITASGSREGGIEIADVSQSITVSWPTVIYFDLELVDLLSKSNQFETVLSSTNEKNLHVLKPGRSYKIRVSASPNSYPGKYTRQEGLKISSDIEFRLICTERMIDIDERCTVLKDSVSSFYKEFEFTVLMECPRVEVEFGWVYYERIGSEESKPATTMKIRIEGTYTPVDTGLMKESNVELDALLPELVAMLYVEWEGEEKLCLHGWDYRGHSLLDYSVGWEIPRLADFIEKPELDLSEDLIDTVEEFSRCGPTKLIDWFGILLKIHREKLCVVIADNRNLEIPWEILALDHKSYLGAQAIVVRWKEVKSYSKLRVLKVGNEALHGSVVAYLDNEESGIEGSYSEQEALMKLKVKTHKYLKELKQHLIDLETLDGIGLVYLGCYGGKDKAIEMQRTLSGRLKSLKLGELKVHSSTRPIVFVNAYKSAVLKQSDGGQLDVMLARLASSFVGTLGPVAPAYASTVLRRVLKAASTSSSGIQVAEVLRQLRAEAVREMTESKRVGENFIHAFMYVYYGNPLILLRLDSVEEAEA